jgi:cytochrome b6-f complex iron-sulfur subunit
MAGKTRRQFLDMILGTAIAGTAASIFYPIIRYLKPLPASGPTGPVRLSNADVEKLRQTKFVIVPVAGKRVMVLRDGKGGLRAFDARCTHEGCTVQYLSRESAIWCACHNARFNLDGTVLSGPPPRPLPAYVVRENADGAIMLGSGEA